MIPVLETPRLLLRPLQLADAEASQRLFAQWEIVQHLNSAVPWPYPADGCLTNIRDVALPAGERGEAWYWSLRLQTAPEELIGRIDLHRSDGNNRGFWLGLPWQGQGLMTEAVIAVTDYWIDVLGFPLLRAPKAAANLASRRISEKTGMRLVNTEIREFVSGTQPAEIWEITAAEWHAVRRRL